MASIGDIVVKIRADIKDLRSKLDSASAKVKTSQAKIKKSLDKTSKSAKGFQTQFSRAATSVAAIQGPLGPLAGRLRSVGALMGGMGVKLAIVALAISGLVAGFRKMVTAAEQANLALIKFEALVKATGMAAGFTTEQLDRMSIRMAKSTLFNVTELREATAVLLTFKAIAGEAFERTMRVAMNLSSVVGTDLKSSVLQLGKALEAPEIGLSMLRRSGVSFTTQQKDVIVALSMTGKKGDALRLILEQIEGQLGDVAEDMAGSGGKMTLSGAIDELGRKLQLFNEQFLKSSGVIQGFTDMIMFLAEIIPVLDHKTMSIDELSDSLVDAESKLEGYQKKLAGFEKIYGSGINTFTRLMHATLKGNVNRWTKNIEELKKAIEDLQNQKPVKTFEEMNKAFEESQMFEEWTKKLIEMQVGLSMSSRALGKYGAELDVWNYKKKLYLELAKKGVKVTDEIRIAIDKLAETYRPLAEELEVLEEAFGHLERGVNKAFSTMENSIIDLIKGTKSLKDVMKNILQQFIADMTTAIIKMLVLDQIKRRILGAVGSSMSSGGTFSKILGAVLGKRATGGSVGSKTPYIVGEKGPELFIPNTSGRVAPMSAAGSANGGGGAPPIVVEQHINFATGVQSTVRAEVMNMLPQIQNSTIAAVQEARVRGGKFAESFGG